MNDLVAVTIDDAVATVVIDNPPVNAMSREVVRALGEVARRLSTDDAVRAIVVTGVGTKAFMAGADITEFAEIVESRSMDSHTAFANGVLSDWARMPQPVIVCLQASAVGGGLEFALTGDVIVAAKRARVGLTEVKLGIIPGGGGTQRLALRAGVPAARRLIMTAAVLDVEEAYRLGVVDYVVEDDDCLATGQRLAHQLAELPRLAVQAAKSLTTPDLDEGLGRERELFVSLTATADFAEGGGAFLERRPPRFTHA
jgi:enoyl-CoA hydratase